MLSASPSLAELAKTYEIDRKHPPRSLAEIPTSTPEAESFAKLLKLRGYHFVGPKSVYAFMQTSAWSTTTSAAASAQPTSTSLLLQQPHRGLDLKVIAPA
jgi:3-methyladenine DNA glycosylase Tag